MATPPLQRITIENMSPTKKDRLFIIAITSSILVFNYTFYFILESMLICL